MHKKTKKHSLSYNSYYGKFPYRVKFNYPACKFLKGNRTSTADIAELLIYVQRELKSGDSYHRYGADYYNTRDLKDFNSNVILVKKLASFLNDLDHDTFKTMYVEPSSGILYTKSKKTFDRFTDQFDEYVTEINIPASDEVLKFMQEKNNRKLVTVKQLPHSKYRFKIFPDMYKFREKFESDLDKTHLTEFINSINEEEEIIKLTPGMVRCLLLKDVRLRTWWYTPQTYFYVSEESILTMIALQMGGVIKKIEQFVTQEEIENNNHDE